MTDHIGLKVGLRTRKERKARHMKAVEAVLAGEKQLDVALRFGVTKQAVSYWLKQYKAGILDGGDARHLSETRKMALRKRAIRLLEKGKKQDCVAAELGVSKSAVVKWWSRYKAGGIESLHRIPYYASEKVEEKRPPEEKHLLRYDAMTSPTPVDCLEGQKLAEVYIGETVAVGREVRVCDARFDPKRGIVLSFIYVPIVGTK